ILERDARPADELADGARHQHFSWPRKCSDAGADVHGDAPGLAVVQLAFAGVNAGAHRKTERTDGFADRGRAANRPRRTVERREHAIPGRLDQVAAKAVDRAAAMAVMLAEQIAPGAI